MIHQLNNDINKSLENITNWLKSSKLTLNISKSKCKSFTLIYTIKPHSNQDDILNVRRKTRTRY